MNILRFPLTKKLQHLYKTVSFNNEIEIVKYK